MSNYDKHTSELSRTMTKSIFENAYRLFIEQADKNAISKKSHGEKLPYGITKEDDERIKDIDGGGRFGVGQHFGQGAASKTPYINWFVVSIYYIPDTESIVMGIERERYPKLRQMTPLRYTQLGNKRTDVAVFYESCKDKLDYEKLYTSFIDVSEQVMDLEGWLSTENHNRAGQIKHNVPERTKKEPTKPVSKYTFVRMIDEEKNISIVRNTDDGNNYVRKEYKLFNKNVFERLKNANIKGIPQIIECAQLGDRLITVEEFIKGHNLKEIIERDGTFDEEEMLHVALQLCDILEALHSMDPPMIHRDIKPSNIMLKESGEVVLIDFNASREHKQGYSHDTVLLGTKDFASPEQVLGYGDSDTRTDIFGLGATLSYIMTGIPIKQLVVPGKYRKILEKCTEIDKRNRYSNIHDLKQALLNA